MADPTPAPLLVTEVSAKAGKTGDREWLIFWVSFSDGRNAGTFSTTIAAIARVALEKRLPVEEPAITPASNGRQKLDALALADATAGADTTDPQSLGATLLSLVTDLSRIRRQVDTWRTMALTLLDDLNEAQKELATLDGSLAERYAKLEAARFAQVVESYDDLPSGKRRRERAA